MGETKTCKDCGREFPKTKEYFHTTRQKIKSGETREYFNSRCKDCARKASRVWERSNRERRRRTARNWQLKRDYGITLEDYERMMEEQNNRCLICQKPSEEVGTLHVDHCHDSMKIRGLLCTNCNRGLGHFQDSAEILARAIMYLEENTDDHHRPD